MRTTTAATAALALLLSGCAHTPPAARPDVRTGAAAFGTWEDDAPGVRRHIRPQDLPAPSLIGNDHEAPDFENAPTVVPAPAGVMPNVPAGFAVEVFATGLNNPRVIRIAPNGDVFVAESKGGRIVVFPAGTSAPAAAPQVFAEGLDRPFGVAFHPVADPRYVYVGEAGQVVRFPYRAGDRRATSAAEVIVAGIPTERHWTRDLAVSADGQRIFVSIGSASNVAAGMPESTPEEIAAHEARHGRGAAWGDETDRAVVRSFNPDGTDLRTFATGLRNCSGMTVQPGTGALWCTGNERDHIGADLAPDYLTTVRPGGFYGWPWYYAGGFEDPAHAGERPELRSESITPDVLLQPHSSTMQLTFYDATAFPSEYRDDIFATMHGSWNRERRTGYKVVRALLENGRPTGIYEDFMTGFVLDANRVWGRPTGIAVTRDGALLVSDDANGTIFRVTYQGP